MTATTSKSARLSPSRRTGKSETVKQVPLAEMSMPDVWREYGRSREDETARRRVRNFLMEKYLHLVRYNAERIYTRLPDEVDVDDLVQAGLFGLMDAIDAFELDRQVKFETFCAPRIRGAILDHLRAMDWVPRLVRHRTAKMDQARQRFEMRHGRPPTQDELTQILGLPDEEFEKVERDGRAVQTHSITRRTTGGDGSKETRDIDVAKSDDAGTPLREMQRRDLKDLITKGLSRAERLIVILYYYEGMTMKEIGSTLDLSESRVSQMHSSILARLKSQMQHRDGELEPMEA